MSMCVYNSQPHTPHHQSNHTHHNTHTQHTHTQHNTNKQHKHTQIVREYINKHSGYEINTEGDSFSIAFLDVPRAVLFCLNVQQRLLETNWPQEVLRLPTCKPVCVFVWVCVCVFCACVMGGGFVCVVCVVGSFVCMVVYVHHIIHHTTPTHTTHPHKTPLIGLRCPA